MLTRSLLLLAALTTACAAPKPVAPPPAPPPPLIRLTLIGTNDLHGAVEAATLTRKDGVTLSQGGVSTLAGYLAAQRADNPGGTVLLDAGDLFQGTLVSNLGEGEVVITAMNHLGYVASALGNHDFDYGPVGPRSVAQPGDDPFGALKARIAQAKFPILAANVFEADGGKRPAWLGNDGTKLVTVAGVTLGIIGLATITTPSTTNPVNVASLRFTDPVAATLEASQRLRAQGAEVVVVTAHAGGKCGSGADPQDLSSCDVGTAEIFQLLEKLPEATVDAVIAGHTHQPLGHFVKGTPVIQTSGQGRAFGVIQLTVDRASRRVLREQTTLKGSIPVCAQLDTATQGCDLRKLGEAATVTLTPASYLGRPIVKDAALDALIDPALEQVKAMQEKKLGVVLKEKLKRDYDRESPLGSFLADSLRALDKADVAVLNAGGLRAELPAGELTFGDVYEVLPFDNTIATVTLTGEELAKLIDALYSGRKGMFQISGVTVELKDCGGLKTLEGFKLADGKPVDPKRDYKVVLPDFLARGGNSLDVVLGKLPPSKIDLGDARPLGVRDALIAWWQSQPGPLAAPPPGRIHVGGCQ